MASPVYGKQFIRFAETGVVADATALNQFTLVKTSGATEPPTLELMAAGGEAFGVLQQDVPAVDPDKATTLARLGTVATSGLLLVAADNANLQDSRRRSARRRTGSLQLCWWRCDRGFHNSYRSPASGDRWREHGSRQLQLITNN